MSKWKIVRNSLVIYNSRNKEKYAILHAQIPKFKYSNYLETHKKGWKICRIAQKQSWQRATLWKKQRERGHKKALRLRRCVRVSGRRVDKGAVSTARQTATQRTAGVISCAGPLKKLRVSFCLWSRVRLLCVCPLSVFGAFVCAFIVYFAFTKPFIRWLRRKESCELSWNLSIAHDISEGCRRKSRQFGFADCVWIGYFFVHIFCLVLFYRCRLRQCVRLNCRPFGRCHEQNEQAWPRHSNSQPH